MRKAINHLKKSDPVLRRIIEGVGPCRMTYREPGFEALARSIVYQQLSGRVAAAILARLVAAAGNGQLTPAGILALSPEEMRSVGLSRNKAAYIRDLAERANLGELDFEAFPRMPDDEVIERLTRVKGIGVWTVQMFLIFALRRPDVLPSGDLGIRSAIRKAYGLEELPKPSEVEELGAKWRPWASVASWYLWRSLEGVAEI